MSRKDRSTARCTRGWLGGSSERFRCRTYASRRTRARLQPFLEGITGPKSSTLWTDAKATSSTVGAWVTSYKNHGGFMKQSKLFQPFHLKLRLESSGSWWCQNSPSQQSFLEGAHVTTKRLMSGLAWRHLDGLCTSRALPLAEGGCLNAGLAAVSTAVRPRGCSDRMPRVRQRMFGCQGCASCTAYSIYSVLRAKGP